MSKLTLTIFVSLDGVIQAPGQPKEDTDGGFSLGGWVFPFVDEVMHKWIVENFKRASAFLLGRRTYEIFASHWPRITDPQDMIAKPLNSLPKHVASRTPKTFEWNGSTRTAVSVSAISELKSRYPEELQIHGSGALANSLLELGLIDRINILTFPVILGAGKRLFAGAPLPSAFTLAESRVTTKGALIASYERGGAVETGSLGLPE